MLPSLLSSAIRTSIVFTHLSRAEVVGGGFALPVAAAVKAKAIAAARPATVQVSRATDSVPPPPVTSNAGVLANAAASTVASAVAASSASAGVSTRIGIAAGGKKRKGWSYG